ncbi:leucyl aminopeptidase [Neisseria sp. Ec49-e6-T10]|uniref:leucyl aminopeptidase n=1 Tax=Neisseria sp. Ec49-e6-T10 TaxID=3140744 RepID=UPI003EC01E6A
MEFSIKEQILQPNLQALTILFTDSNNQLSSLGQYFNEISAGLLQKAIEQNQIGCEAGKRQFIEFLHEEQLVSLLLVGLGAKEHNKVSLDKMFQKITKSLPTEHKKQAIELDVSFVSAYAPNLSEFVSSALLSINDAYYQYNQLKTDVTPNTLEQVIVSKSAVDTQLEQLVQNLAITADAINFAKDLGNAPANLCTPQYLSEQAEQWAKKAGANVHIHNKEDIINMGMGSFWSVAKGSTQSPYFIELNYQGTKAQTAPYVLVGKGITFDSGGISLKPGEGMDEMKYDMCGAATVIATFYAAAKMKLPINLVALVPTCENMPSGGANKPGDIVTSMSGQTIEVLNTDAEGRLILCDALTYAKKFNPQAVIDVATLTGACIIALGHIGSAVIGNDQTLIDQLLQASQSSNDKAWQMPMWDEYQEQLHSNFADIANIGGRPAGTITAACFLSRFTENYAWAHLDIAGTAWKSGKEKGSTGRPVPLLLAFLQQASSHH